MKIVVKKNFSIASDFKKRIQNKTRRVNISLQFNKINSLLYLKRNWKLNNIISKYQWLKYNESEEHLSKISKIIKNYKNKNLKKIFCCSYKDISLQNKLSTTNDNYVLGKIKNIYKGVEICQQEINKIKIKKKYNIILCRHILEHAFNLTAFIKNLQKISTDDAIYYFEVPDCEKLIKNFEYLIIWEEHLTYFFKSTLINFLENKGFKILKFIKIKQRHENLLCVIAKKKLFTNKKKISNLDKQKFLSLVVDYQKQFENVKKKILNFFRTNKSRKFIIFGAGHTANTFINLFNLSSKINFIVDENKKKVGKFFPGTCIKIINVSKFKKIKDPNICLIASDPAHDIKIEKKLKNKLSKIYSIISTSKKFILHDQKN
jgi:hypothetical protein